MKIDNGFSACCLVLRGQELFHANVEYVGRCKFSVKDPDRKILGKTVDASEIIDWNLAPI